MSLPSVGDISDTIVVLAIGWPLTDDQRAVLDAAEELARSAQVVLDARLLSSADAAADLVGSADRLVLDARPREARRIRRRLAHGLSAPGAR